MIRTYMRAHAALLNTQKSLNKVVFPSSQRVPHCASIHSSLTRVSRLMIRLKFSWGGSPLTWRNLRFRLSTYRCVCLGAKMVRQWGSGRWACRTVLERISWHALFISPEWLSICLSQGEDPDSKQLGPPTFHVLVSSPCPWFKNLRGRG